MGKYKKRKDGRYATSFVVGYDNNGTAKRKLIYGRTIAELEKNITEFKSLMNKGIIINDKNLTLAAWAERWIELYKKDKSYNTYSSYKGIIERYIIPQIGSIRLKALKQNHIQQALNDIVDSGKQRTAELFLLTVRQIIQQAMAEEYIYRDITLGLSLPEKQKPKKRSLTEKEKDLIQAAELTPKERLFVDILYYTGIRRGEALSLTRNDIDLDNGTITISKNLVMKNNESEIKLSPKTKAGFRKLPIPQKLLPTLENYIAGMKCDYLFTKADGEIMTKSAFRCFWENIKNKIDIADDVTPHIFRHTYATALYYSGIDVKTAQYLLGHSSIQMTLDVYTHLDDEKIAASKSKLDEFF